jgi:esterase/lipase superfamily enzyme/outer membrane protein OmpA-like peptidoglycan-associated protein
MRHVGAVRLVLLAVALASVSGCASVVTRHPDFGADCDSFDADVDCVRVFYGTSRALTLTEPEETLTETGELDVAHGAEAAGPSLVLGRADVWLPRLGDAPDQRQRGETPLATGTPPRTLDEQEKFVFITRITATGRTRFVRDLQHSVDLDGDGAVLLFVHGFNTGFDSALIRSAQLTVDLREDNRFNPGAPVLFTWPSQGRMSIPAYRQDEQAAAAAVPRLEAFLDLLTGELSVTRINIIAHSMGNRVLTGALEAFAEDYLARHPDRPVEFRIILAAADLEQDIYRLAADQIAALEPNVTIYTSDSDRALQFSRLINGVTRLGETDRNRPFIRPEAGYATIDATPVASELFGIGHSYYSNNPFILSDIRCAMADLPTAARALQLRRYADAPDGEPYFRIDPAGEAGDRNCNLRRDRFLTAADVPDPVPAALAPPPPVSAPPPPPPLPPPPVALRDQQFVAYFDIGQAAPGAEGRAVVEQAAAYVLRFGPGTILLEAHTDSSGSAAANDRLALRRAEAVRDQLAALGVDPSQVLIEVRGERNPAVATEDGVAEVQNRRVVITIRLD